MSTKTVLVLVIVSLLATIGAVVWMLLNPQIYSDNCFEKYKDVYLGEKVMEICDGTGEQSMTLEELNSILERLETLGKEVERISERIDALRTKLEFLQIMLEENK